MRTQPLYPDDDPDILRYLHEKERRLARLKPQMDLAKQRLASMQDSLRKEAVRKGEGRGPSITRRQA